MNENDLNDQKEIMEFRAYCEESWSNVYEEAREDARMRSGDQWDEGDKRDRAAKGRPSLTVNRVEKPIDIIVGNQRSANTEIIVLPETVDDGERFRSQANLEYTKAQVISGTIQSIWSDSEAEVAVSYAFEQSVGNGFGFFRVITEYIPDTFEQRIRIVRVLDPFSCYIDPDNESGTLDDTNRAIIINDDYMEFKDGKRIKGKRIEYYRRNKTKKKIILLADGRIVSPKQFEDMTRAGEPAVFVRERETEAFEVEWMLSDGNEIIERSIIPSIYVPVIMVTGKESMTEQGRMLRSAIRSARDPQRMVNYFKSSAVELVAQSPKAPYILADKQVAEYRRMWDTAHISNRPYLIYKHVDGIKPPSREPPPPLPAGFEGLALSSLADIEGTTLYGPSLGNVSQDRTGAAITARQDKGDVGVYMFHDNLRRALHQTGRLLVDMIPRVYDTERFVPVRNDQGDEDFVKINAPGAPELGGKFRIRVRQTPQLSTQREEASQGMTSLLQFAPEMGPELVPMILRNSDWPLAREVAEKIEKKNQLLNPQQVQQIVQQEVAKALQATGLDIQRFEAETNRMEVKAEAENDAARTRIEAEKAKTDRMKAISALRQGQPGVKP